MLGLKRARVWKSLENMLKLLEKATLNNSEIDALNEEIKIFTRAHGRGMGRNSHYTLHGNLYFSNLLYGCH